MAKENISNHRFMDMQQIIAKVHLLFDRNPFDNSFLLIHLSELNPDWNVIQHGNYQNLGRFLSDNTHVKFTNKTEHIILELAKSILSQDQDKVIDFMKHFGR